MAEPKEDLTNVPASVLQQQRDADKLIKDAANPEPPAQVPDLNTDDPPNPVVPAPTDPPVIDTQPVAPVINDGTTDDGQWQHKYSVLQGKYNKEVGDLKSMVIDLKGQMERQQTVIEGLNSQQLETTPAVPKADDLNPEDFAGWGDEMKTMVNQINQLNSVVRDQAAIINGLKPGNVDGSGQNETGLQTRVESLETEVHDGRITSYLKFLDDNVKGEWRKLNKSANFNKWINQVDPISMQPRLASLTAAAEQLRGAQVASIFNLYIQAIGENSDISIAEPLPSDTGNGHETPVTTAKVTQADVTKAQSDFVKKRITEEEFDKIYAAFQKTLKR